jgi:hypothetical protein
MRSYRLLILLVVLMTGFAVTAHAVPITFTHEGVGSGSYGPSEGWGVATLFPPTTSFTITALGDTDNRVSDGSVYFIEHDSASIIIGGFGTFEFTMPTKTYVNNTNSIVGFGTAEPPRDRFNGPKDSAFATWDMLSSIGPISGSGTILQWDSNYPDVIVDDDTVLHMASASSPATFTATMGAAPGPSIPEPATMLLLGSGLIGLVGFGRKKFRKS